MNTEERKVGDGGVPSVRDLHKLLMLVTTVVRMIIGLITFIILARYLGPHGFGVVATAMAYSGFTLLISDFGFGISALREAAASPENSAQIIREALWGKAALTLAITFAGAMVVIAVTPSQWWLVYALIHAGTICYSMGELFLVAPRAARRFDVEAKLVFIGSVMMLVVASIPVWLTGSAIVAAAAFACSRLLNLGIIALVVTRQIAGPRPSLKQLIARLRSSIGYAADGFLTNLSSQIDILLLGAMLTPREVGIYQAGARLVQVIMPFAGVLASVYLPALSAAAIKGNADAFRSIAQRLNFEFAGLALLAGGGFLFVGPIVTSWLYGSSYDALLGLWPGFTAFAVLRLTAAGYGIQLTSMGFTSSRIIAQSLSIVTFIISAFIFLPRVGLAASAWLLAVASLPIVLCYVVTLARSEDKVSARSALWTGTLSFVLVAFLACWQLIRSIS